MEEINGCEEQQTQFLEKRSNTGSMSPSKMYESQFY